MSSYWSQYWQQGHLTSFGNDFSGNYTGTLKLLWEELFNNIPEANKILDVGTGNGSLIAIGINTNPKLVFSGLDSAKLTIPEAMKNLANVSFMQETSAEDIPIQDSVYDYVISQFGIEYSNLTKSLPEVSRVLKQGGHFQFVLHDSGSTIVKPNIQILNAAKALLNASIIDTLRELINGLAKYGQKSAITEQLRQQLNTNIASIATQHASGLHGTNFPAFLKHVMNPNLNLKQKKADLKLFLSELDGQIVRLSDLVNAALSDSKYQHLKTLLADNRLDVLLDEPIFENTKLIGRSISGIKATN